MTLKFLDILPELDLVALAPDGRLAGFCVAWLNRSSVLIKSASEFFLET